MRRPRRRGSKSVLATLAQLLSCAFRAGVAARLGFAALAICASSARAEDAPDVTPYRPSVSTPAALSAPGWLELEVGLTRARSDDPRRRDSLPYAIKLAFTEDWGVRLGGDAWIRQTDSGGDVLRGGGDTTIVAKRRFARDDDSAFGIEVGAKVPSAARDLGSGRMDWGFNAIHSADFAEGWHVDANLAATRIGGVEPGVGRVQQLAALSLSYSLSDRWSLGAELSGTAQRGLPGTRQALVAASFSVQRGLTLDCGLSKGLNHASGGWSAFCGATLLAWRLF